MDLLQPNRVIPGSDIRISAEGRWFYRGDEMIRRDIVRLFYQNLTRDKSGAYSINIGPQTYPVEVEDTAYVVWSIDYVPEADNAEECIFLRLSDDSTEQLDPATLRIGKNNIPYCRVLDGRFDARFSKAGYYQIAEYITYDPQPENFYLSLNGNAYLIKAR